MALLAMVVACQPRKDFPEVGGDFNTREAVIGNWTITAAVQNDNGAIDKNFPDKAKFLNLMDLYPGLGTLKVSISGGADSTFKVTLDDLTAEDAAFLPLGDGYKWRFIDPTNGPRYIEVFKRDAAGAISESLRVDFGKPNKAAANKLELRIARRNEDGAVFTSYDYKLRR